MEGVIAYESDQTGRLEVYVRSFPDLSAGRWQVSTDGGMAPIWGRDGRELFYVHQSAIVSVALEMNGTVKASAPEVLFDNPEYVLTRTWNWRAFDLSLDGKRFLMVKKNCRLRHRFETRDSGHPKLDGGAEATRSRELAIAPARRP